MHWKTSLLLIHKILRLFIKTFTVNDKLYLLNRDNLRQPIQMLLSKEQNTFSQFFFAFLKSILNFKHLKKKDDPPRWCLSGNTGSEKYDYINVGNAVFQRTLRKTVRQMGRNAVAILIAACFHYLLINVKLIALKRVFFSDTRNPKALCYHIDSQWQTLSTSQRQFTVTKSDGIIWETKNFFSVFFFFFFFF